MGLKLTQQEIIKKCIQIHGDKYDYSLLEYNGDSCKVKIICPKHGVFEQKPGSHIRQKQGCKQCFLESREKKNRLSTEEFIKRIEKKFGINKYDYSLLEYNGAHKPVTLICKKCQNIETKDPTVWYQGFGCSKCRVKRVNPKKTTLEQFLLKAKKIHGNKYDYSKVHFKSIYEEVEIICPKHGVFKQKPVIHIFAKANCQECKITKGEEAISIFLNEQNIKYIFQYKVKIENSYHYFDFYLPKQNIIIEFNGLQHYKPIPYFGGQKTFDFLQIRDKIKKDFCLDKQIKLIIISYNDDIVSKLNNLNIKQL